MFVAVYLCLTLIPLVTLFSSGSSSKAISFYTCNLLLDFQIAFVVEIHSCNNFGDNRHGLAVGFATRVYDDLVQQEC